MRALGLDVGSKTIGVAVSDELGIAAHPLCVISRRGTEADARAIAELATAERAEALVVGMPFELSGKEGPRAARVRVFIAALRAISILPMFEQDERFSTVEAERLLISGGVKRGKRAAVIDKQAAAIILQAWLARAKP
ncbi:MAG: Holliday junction resolvase RuvX [Myxococcales bacterium]|nr:Holliday junction resolvase RuvX [Myxococcales bacterium]